MGEGVRYVNHYTLTLDFIANADYLSSFKQRYLEQLQCRVGSDKKYINLNVTWIGDNEVTCSFENFYSQTLECVELSINGGTDYTSTCGAQITSYRVPFASSYSPLSTLLLNSATITITGKNFMVTELYTCVFNTTSIYHEAESLI